MWQADNTNLRQKTEAILFAGVSAEMVECSPGACRTESGL